MSITDELRSWVAGAKPAVINGCEISVGPLTSGCRGALTAIADRIDAEHESACAEAYGNGVMSVPIALDENAWVKLPKDADGVPIHIGDVMEWCDSGDTLEVIGIGDDTLFYIDPEGDRTYAEWTSARNKRHHHAPTVEDVLREFAYGLGVPVADSYIAASAAKLRLRGDAE